MIVKIQLPLEYTGDPEALIYNEDRSFDQMFGVTGDLLKVMKKRPKAFFHAEALGVLADGAWLSCLLAVCEARVDST